MAGEQLTLRERSDVETAIQRLIRKNKRANIKPITRPQINARRKELRDTVLRRR